MTRQFDNYCQEMAMEDLESEVPQEWVEERKQRLAKVAERASRGEHVVLIYPAIWPAKEDMHSYRPEALSLKVSDMLWCCPSGWVAFRTVGMPPETLRGLVAEIIWIDDAYECASQPLRDMVAERNSQYKHRMNTRYPVDESDC